MDQLIVNNDLSDKDFSEMALLAMSDAVFITKDNGEFVFICPNVHIIFGYSASEIEAKRNIFDLIEKDIIKKINFDISSISAEIKNIESIIKTKDGLIKHILINIKKVSIHNGTRLFSMRDITELKEKDRLLYEHEMIFKNIFEQSPVGKEIYDKQGILQIVNNACLNIFGVSHVDEIKKFNLFNDPNILPSHIDDLKKGKQVSYEVQFDFDLVKQQNLYNTTKSGKIPIDVIITPLKTPLKDNNFEITGYLVQVTDSSEIKKVNEILSKKTEELDRYFTRSLDLLCIANTDGYFLRLNPEWTNVLGYSQEELVGIKFLDLIHPDDLQPTLDAISTLSAQRPVMSFTNRYRTKTGYYKWIEWRSFPENDLIYAVARDITKRKKLENIMNMRIDLLEYSHGHTLTELLQKTLDHAELLTNSKIGFYHFVDSDQKNLTLQTWSTNTMQKFCKAEGSGLHYSIEQAGVWVDCVYSRVPVIHNDYKALAHKKGLPPGHAPVERELVVPVIRDSKIVAILGVGNKQTIYDQSDIDIINYLADTDWGIIESKINEEKLKESEARWKFALEGAGDGIWDWNVITNQVFFSIQWKRMFGYEENDIGSLLSEWEKRVHPDDKEKIFKDLQNHCAGKIPLYTNEYRILCKNGSYKWILDRGKVIARTKEGGAARVIGTHTDISERKKIEDEQKKIQEKLYLASKLASVGSLAAGVAHEINNPLTIVMGNIALIEDIIINADMSQYNKNEIIDLLETQDAASIRIATIVDRLINYARIEASTRKTIKLNQIINETLSLCETIYQKTNIFIETRYCGDHCFVAVNPGEIKQAIMNILNNSRDAILEKTHLEKSHEGKIIIETFAEAQSVVIKIIDNGIGIDPTNIKRLFDPFWTTKPVGKGTGLGLSISQTIVHSFGGTLSIESILHIGTTATIKLPIATGGQNQNLHECSDVTDGSKYKPLVGSVLIIDDEEGIRKLLKHYLTQFGLQVDEARDGKEGLEKATTNSYDYLITDIKLPKMNGDQLITAIKKLPHVPKIITITGGFDSDFSEKRMDILIANANALIIKPFDKQSIYNALISEGS
ncbi:MAG: PAS domain S-box protein [Oligoflexia bacterium]|nr:PAS domain S-box protein [Oligoflexia bacterium]